MNNNNIGSGDHDTATKIVQFLNQSRLRHFQGELYTAIWDDASNIIQLVNNSSGKVSFSATWNDQVANWENTGTPLTEEIIQYANSLVPQPYTPTPQTPKLSSQKLRLSL